MLYVSMLVILEVPVFQLLDSLQVVPGKVIINQFNSNSKSIKNLLYKEALVVPKVLEVLTKYPNGKLIPQNNDAMLPNTKTPKQH